MRESPYFQPKQPGEGRMGRINSTYGRLEVKRVGSNLLTIHLSPIYQDVALMRPMRPSPGSHSPGSTPRLPPLPSPLLLLTLHHQAILA